MKLRHIMAVTIAMAATAAGLTVVAQAPASATSDPVYNQVAELADQLNSMPWTDQVNPAPPPDQADYNAYPGTGMPNIVVWGTPGQPTTYLSKTRCAALFTAVLKRTFPSWATNTYLQTEFGNISPFAADYYQGLVDGKGAGHFTVRTTVPQLGRGDVIAIKYTGTTGGTGEPTGHVMIVAGTPSLYDRDNNSTTREWAVPVIDSTTNPHGVARANPSSTYHQFPDTRSITTPIEKEYSGVGRGWIFISTTSADQPTGYWWGVNENVTTEYHPMSDRPMVFASIA